MRLAVNLLGLHRGVLVDQQPQPKRGDLASLLSDAKSSATVLN
jgi:hypothetical protein